MDVQNIGAMTCKLATKTYPTLGWDTARRKAHKSSSKKGRKKSVSFNEKCYQCDQDKNSTTKNMDRTAPISLAHAK